LHTTTTSCTKL